jgi:hypothetical protein
MGTFTGAPVDIQLRYQHGALAALGGFERRRKLRPTFEGIAPLAGFNL